MAKPSETAKIAAVLLAAGQSTRLGQSKQLVEIDGESLVRRLARHLLGLDPVCVTVVTGYGYSEVQRAVGDLPVKVVRNEGWEQGIGSSIACGARNSPEEIDGLLVAVCDLWKLDALDLERLLTAWTTDISRISIASWFDEESFVYGPPAIFPRKLIRELTSLTGNQGAKALVARHQDNVQFIEVENAAYDLDTPADLEQVVKRR